jgi:dihydroorotate dehydrogenase electron transfer subunit
LPGATNDYLVKIEHINLVAQNTFRISLEQANISRTVHAGQFVNIKIPSNEILWRRPFSVHKINPAQNTFDILFNAIGRGTAALSKMEIGQQLQVLGPLGKAFVCPENTKEIIIVAGGLGIALFLLLLQDLADRDISKHLFYGVKTGSQACCTDEIRSLGAHLHLVTEDGSEGQKGLVTDILEQYLLSLPAKDNRMVYVCGPHQMLVEAQKLVKRFGLKGQLSVENMMACGFGACMGCPVRMAQPTESKRYYLACTDGPVFDLDEVTLHD